MRKVELTERRNEPSKCKKEPFWKKRNGRNKWRNLWGQYIFDGTLHAEGKNEGKSEGTLQAGELRKWARKPHPLLQRIGGLLIGGIHPILFPHQEQARRNTESETTAKVVIKILTGKSWKMEYSVCGREGG
jgi:hypothetical protein